MINYGRARQGTAGARAERRYRELRREWSRRVLPRARLVLWPVIGLACLGVNLPSPWSWITGAVAGSFFALWLEIRDQLPSHIENWKVGAEGERKTARQLASLEGNGWTVVHDLEGRFGNVDHLAVGPGGAYILDSKVWNGQITLERGRIAVRGPGGNTWSPDKPARALRRACARNHDALKELTGVSQWVTPVMVLWGEFPVGHATVDGVEYVRGDLVREWLLSQPQRLGAQSIARLVSVVG